MKITFEVCLTKSNLKILGLTNNSEYLNESLKQDTADSFKFSETYTINVLEYIRTSKQQVLHTSINNHSQEVDIDYIELPQDGNYKIYHIIIPSIQWLNNLIDENSELLSQYNIIYVTDGNTIYKYIDKVLEPVTPEEIIRVNSAKTTLSKDFKEIFSIDKLYECYLNLCSIIYNKLLKESCFKIDDNQIIFNRDFLWMLINCIKYNINFGYYKEAQRLLEKLDRCTSICKNKIKFNDHECGCS